MTQQINTPGHPQPPLPPVGAPGQPAAPYGQSPCGPPPAGFGPPQPPAPRKKTGAIVGAVVGVLVLVAGLAVGAVLLFGTTTIDTAEAERQIATLTEEQVGVAAADVSCPEDVEAEAGGTFSCTATLDGQPIRFTVEQTDAEGNVQIESDETFVVVATVEESLAQQVGAEAGVEAVATCETEGRGVLVGATGTPIPCTVTNAEDATDSIDVLATVDEAGDVSYEVA
ncbi:DUF4333 domain-containing protein [Geodermatophilus sabuli]|uniref:DUF4333 domain-containing protein n=1 Tax=Geodermatophilus sabuli TaxID=1564158 RepID=A0A285E8A5_9ACTN|nr:DUF4333 domain-containing protein [Geodermatophilus sabuli]MBB3082690.1 hypothetical protein [Geodermatophilus sabuli]SNX94444.1 protein of unknown function [Geodermatophilus sabuli]